MTIFTKIINGEIPSNKVHESGEFLAFHDINPKAPIHVLIIPKTEYRDFQEIPGDVMAKMTPFIQETADILGLNKNGYRLITNIGQDGGQEVFHIHFHMLGGAPLKWTNLTDSMDEARKSL